MNARLLLLTLAFFPMAGCATLPFTHEIESTVLMRTLGIDVGSESIDGVAVTASASARPGAGTQMAEPSVILSAQANTIAAACHEMQGFGEKFVFYGDVEQVVVGEGQAQRSLETVLTHVSRDRELRLEAQLWVVRGGAASELLFPAAEGDGAGARLEAMQQDAGLFSEAVPKTAREALVELSRNGCTVVPSLALAPSKPGDGSKTETVIVPAGYAVFRDGALVGWTDEQASRGVNLMLGQVSADILELTTPDCSQVALKITGARTSITPDIYNGTLMGLVISCKVEADVVERRGDCTLNKDTLDWLEAQLSAVTTERIRSTLELAQRLRADFLALKTKAAIAAPWSKKLLEAQWDALFSSLSMNVTTQARVSRE